MTPLTAALIKRLRASVELTAADVSAIESLPFTVRSFRENQTLTADGERPNECCLISEGFCVRSKTIVDGRRQILSIHIPGDIPDLQSLHLPQMDHDLVAVTDTTGAFIPHVALKEIARKHPSVGDAFWRDTLIDAAIFREWIVNIGQRAAANRLAHIVMELLTRLRSIGLVQGNRFAMPLTQEQFGEALGITGVHTSRIVSHLRQEGVLDLHRGVVTVFNERRLRDLADFDDRYLHIADA